MFYTCNKIGIYITKQFTYDIPDKWQEQETTLGKTSTQTYTGPDKVISFVQNGRIVSTHNKDKDDGRPCPADWEPVEIDLLNKEFYYWIIPSLKTVNCIFKVESTVQPNISSVSEFLNHGNRW